MFSLFKKSQEKVVAVFDIGNGSIGGALVSLTPNTPPQILYTHREPLTFIPDVTSKRLLDTMLKLLGTVATNVQKEGLSHIGHPAGNITIAGAHCIFSSPWYISQTKSLKTSQEKDFSVSRDYIDTIIKKEEKDFNTAQTNGEYEKLFGTAIRLVEQKIIHTKLNGYEITNPIGKKARDLDLTFYMSFMSEEIASKTEAVLRNTFHHKNTSYSSYALASWDAARTMFPDTTNFLFMDISGEVTDISLTKDGSLMETVSFPFGRSFFIRYAIEQLSIPPEVALSFLTMSASGTADPAFKSKIDAIIETAGEKWRGELVLALQELGKRYTLPQTIFVTVDSDLAEYFLNPLKKPLPPELNISQNAFVVNVLDTTKVKHFVNFASVVHEDPFIGIESVFLHNSI